MKKNKSWRGYNTLTLKYVPERSVIYSRVSDASQNKDSQLKMLEKHFPDLFADADYIFISDEMKGNTPIEKRFKEIPKKHFVCSTHPDRVAKTDECPAVLRMVAFFRKKKLKLTFPEIKNLVIAAEQFWSDPTPEKFQIMVSARMMEHANPQAETNTLSREQKRMILEVYSRLYKAWDKNPEWDDDHLFWALYAHMGHAVNQALKTTNAKAREKSDNTFGTKPEQIKLVEAMEEYWDDDLDLSLKEMARMLAKNRKLTTKTGRQYSLPYLSRVKNNELGTYRDLNPEIKKVLNWTQKREAEFQRKKVQPKNSMIREGMKRTGFDTLYKPQNKALKKLIRGEPVILQDRSGGGKNEIPIMWHMITGDLVVAVMPTLALMENYRDRLLKHFDKDEVGVYNSKTSNSHAKIQNLLRRRELSFLLTTPEQMAKKELMAAVRANREGLLFFDECHNFSFSGLTYRPKYRIGNIRKIVNKLDGFTCLFASATVDYSSYMDIIDIVEDCEYISGSLSRPNLKLFRWRLKSLGHKLMAVHKLLSNLRSEGLKKGILYFSTVESVLRAKEKLEELGHPCTVYFGKDKEGWDWETKRKNLQKFASSKSMIMLATCSFGEGLNFKDVRFVICMDMPGSLEELYQWVGRAGRSKKNVKNAPVFLMDDPLARASRKFLFESNKENEASKKFQRERYGELLKFLEKHPKPSMKDLAEEIK